LTELVRNYVKEYILENNLNAGDSLPPETHLARDLGVARSSVREAVKSLESLGFVEVQPGNGLFVREYNFDPLLEMFTYGIQFDANTLSELLQIRQILELAMMDEAVRKIDAGTLAQLDELMAEWETRSQTGEPFADLDQQFHNVLYSMMGNQTMLKLFDVFWVVFDNISNELIHDADPIITYEEHRAILEAVRARDVERARRRLEQSNTHLPARIERYQAELAARS
jgi:DNA-binding FadR family transcriptional regulator